MTRTSHILTQQDIDSFKISKAYCDGKGLYFELRTTGSKNWHYRYKFNNKNKKMGLGGYPTVSINEAREIAKACRTILKYGKKDPGIIFGKIKQKQSADTFSEPKLSLKPITFAQCVAEYTQYQIDAYGEESHWRFLETHLSQLISPELGKRRIQDISTDDILSIIKPIWINASQCKKAIDLRFRLEAIFDYAFSCNYTNNVNPARWQNNLEKELSKSNIPTSENNRVRVEVRKERNDSPSRFLLS